MTAIGGNGLPAQLPLRSLHRTQWHSQPEAGTVEQLLLHLIGDYVTQTDWMARSKASTTFPALCHAVVYSLPFLLLSPSLAAIVVIAVSHFLIDRFRLARHLAFAKNKLTGWHLRWEDCRTTGYPPEVPLANAFWLMILLDNTMHLAINYAALRWL
jgi:Protein of unknown function (DUF3307)